jgi:HlyD family secretion protein
MKVNRVGQVWRFILEKKVWFIGAVVILLVGVGLTWYFTQNNKAKTTVKTGPAYYTAAVKTGSIKISAAGSGTLQASQVINLSFSASGTVGELNVKAGDLVTQGQVLAKLADLTQLNANIASDQLQILQDQNDIDTLTTNAAVSLAQAYQDWVTAKATDATALNTQEHTAYARCSQDQTTSLKTKLDAAQTSLNEAQAKDPGSAVYIKAKSAYDTAQANYTYCTGYTADEKASANASLQLADVQLKQAELKYNTLNGNGGIDPNTMNLAQAKLSAAKTQLSVDQNILAGANLIAPIDGRVISVAGNVGSMVDTSTFISIATTDKPSILVSISESDMAKMTVGNKATLVFDALPDQTFTGTVTQVNPQLVTSGQYQLIQGIISLDAATIQALQKLPLGLSVTVDVISKEANNALLIPVSAVHTLGTNEYAVFVVNRNNTLQLRSVQVSLMDDTHAAITSGLSAGDVVSTGLAQVVN